jgi:putative transposase
MPEVRNAIVRGISVVVIDVARRVFAMDVEPGWQRRFWEHAIRDDADFERHVDYIHFNPVKHGYVKGVSAWPYSSFHRFVRNGLLPQDWGGDLGEIEGRFGE